MITFSFWQLWIKLLQIFACEFLCEYIYVELTEWMLGNLIVASHDKTMCSARLPSKVAVSFFIPSTMNEWDFSLYSNFVSNWWFWLLFYLLVCRYTVASLTVLNCISLVINHVEFILICLLSLCISSFVMYLFKIFCLIN